METTTKIGKRIRMSTNDWQDILAGLNKAIIASERDLKAISAEEEDAPSKEFRFMIVSHVKKWKTLKSQISDALLEKGEHHG